MKDIVPPPPPSIVRNDTAAIQALFQQNVVPSYGRFDIVLSHGSGSYIYDVAGKRYLDLGGGIAVSSLGHGHPAITEALVEQSRKLIHCSNFYYQAAATAGARSAATRACRPSARQRAASASACAGRRAQTSTCSIGRTAR